MADLWRMSLGVNIPDTGDELRAAIRSSELSLREIGRLAGVDPSQLSRFVRGERGLTLVSVTKLARLFGLTMEVKP